MIIIRNLPLDGMNKAAYTDDSYVRRITAELIPAKEERAAVTIREIEKSTG